ncbi:MULTISPECIES: M50 family metallopeptidase [unclassified Lysobacter]|uniref:M50 family metallopeptidase n=1 Tax=unclassified Lysobacter TaxID=2635362 RepID=UPI00070B20EC|nr:MULTISPECIES: M50 family metallopeptidase [unclassified Lysobacter]KRD40028.1 hypothetical protein ASE35_06900 [Lysobacter sp. Root916]KRD80057.1 hypothetical protein ASE43_04010 [Lysobacter sp. Root983]
MDAADEKHADQGATAPWSWSPRLNRVMEALAAALAALSVLGAALACSSIVEPLSGFWALSAGVLLFMALTYLALAVHEFGHYLGARLRRMIVLAVAIGPVEFYPVVGGWRPRPRERRHVREVGGYVVAFPDPDRPPRGDFAVMLLGGPLANLVLTLSLAALLATMEASHWQLLCIALALLNFAGFACNLLPYQTKSLATDGLQLLRLRHWPSDMHTDPWLVWMRLMGRSLRGVTADELPEHEMRVLAERADALPLQDEWFQLKALQNRGDWRRVDEVERALNRSVAALDEASLASMSSVLLLMRAEIAFCRSMASGDAGHVEAVGLTPALRRDVPYLMPRLQALASGLRGDVERSAAAMERSCVGAETSIDVATRRCEARLRGYMRAIIEQRRAAS